MEGGTCASSFNRCLRPRISAEAVDLGPAAQAGHVEPPDYRPEPYELKIHMIWLDAVHRLFAALPRDHLKTRFSRTMLFAQPSFAARARASLSVI